MVSKLACTNWHHLAMCTVTA